MRHVHQAYSIAKFKCDMPMQCIFDAIQIDKRFLRGDPNYEYSNSRIFLFKDNGEQQTFIGGGFSTSKYNTLRVDLTEGNYYLVGMLDWRNEVYDFTISAYAEGEIVFERVHYRDNADLLSYMLESYMAEQTSPKMLAKNPEFMKYEKSVEELQMKIELFVNKSSTNTLNVHKKITKSENASLLNLPLGEKNDLSITVLPESSKIVLVGNDDCSKPFIYHYEDR